MQFDTRKTKTQSKNDRLNRYFSKEDTQIAKEHREKNPQYH